LVTIDKRARPKIYTESDHILNDLKEELAGLKSRMSLIEEEQEKNRTLLEQLSFQEDLANELIVSQQQETEANRVNYKVIANAMKDLRSPVSSVVENLAGIMSEIDDSYTKDTLKECMNTATNVLNSFTEVEAFCEDVSGGISIGQRPAELKSFFQETVSSLQREIAQPSNCSLRLLVDKTLPEKTQLFPETIKLGMEGLLKELVNSTPAADIAIRISAEHGGEKYGIELSDLAIELLSDKPTTMQWNDSWFESIQMNQSNLLNLGFNLLRVRESLRKSGGQLEICKENSLIIGFKILLPLT